MTTTAGTFHDVYKVDGINGDAVPEPEDAHEEGKLCQDTTWSRHDLSRCLFLSHTPSQDQQTTADEGTFHFVTNTAPSSVIEYVAPALAVTHAALSPAIEYVAPTPAVTQI